MIEKNIHQIWIGNKRIPKHIKEWMQEVKDRHSDFTYYLWTDDNLPEMPTELYDIYKNISDPVLTSAKSDLLRIYVTYKYGGMYLDADFKVINGFDGSSEGRYFLRVNLSKNLLM
jgi:mannosyltransferase OCH1-like enzyme